MNHPIFEPLIDILEHIKDVQTDMITLSEKSASIFFDHFEQQGLEFTDDVTKALQYQDIFSQQLSVIAHAVTTVADKLKLCQNPLDVHDHSLLENLRTELDTLLDDARHKKVAYMGDALVD